MLLATVLIWYFMHRQDGVEWRSNVHLLLHMAHFQSLTFTFDGKNQGQWGATCNIAWPSHHHLVIANFTQHLFGDFLIFNFGPIISNLVCDLLNN